MNILKKISAKTLIGLIGLFYLVLATIRDLSIPDEGRYGDISRWMFQHQDYLTPRINGVPFLHKPPLLHWLTSPLLQIFGTHDWVYRLVPIVASLAMLSGMYWFVNRHGQYLLSGKSDNTSNANADNATLAKISTLVLAFSLLMMGAGQYVNHDMLVGCWITLTALCFAGYVLKPKLSILMLGYVSCALGFLSKGLIGILVPGMIILPWVLWTKNWRKIPSLLNPLGIVLLLLIDMPWLYFMNQKYPDFLRYFFIEQQFERFSSTGFNNHQPWFFYIICLLVSFLPFILLMSRPKKGVLARSSTLLQHNPVIALLAWWGVSCLVFFSIPQSKLIGYILPMVAPLAILIATGIYPKITINASPFKKWQVYAMPVFTGFLGIALLLVGFFHVVPSKTVFNIHYVQVASVVTLLVAVLLFIGIKKHWGDIFSRTLLAVATVFFAIVCCVQGLDTKKNADVLTAMPSINQSTPIIFYQSYYYDLPVMLNTQQPAYVVRDWQNVTSDNSFMELKDGLRFEPALQQFLIDEPEFLQLFQNNRQLLIFVPKNTALPDSIKNFAHPVGEYHNFTLWQK